MSRQPLTFMTEIESPRPWADQNLTPPYLIQQWFCDDTHRHVPIDWRKNHSHAHGVPSDVQPNEETTFPRHGSGDRKSNTVTIWLRQLSDLPEQSPRPRVERRHDNVHKSHRDGVQKGRQDGLVNLKSGLGKGARR